MEFSQMWGYSSSSRCSQLGFVPIDWALVLVCHGLCHVDCSVFWIPPLPLIGNLHLWIYCYVRKIMPCCLSLINYSVTCSQKHSNWCSWGSRKLGHMWTECMASSLAGLRDLQYLPEVYIYFKKVAVAGKGKLSYLCGLEKEASTALSVCCNCSSRKGWDRNLSALAESRRFSFYLICAFDLLLYHLIGPIDNVCFRNEAWVSISQPDSQSILLMCAFSLQR